MDAAMRPLGLSLAERPTVKMVPRGPTMPGYSARLFGPTVMTGKRHGHKVAAVLSVLARSDRWNGVNVHGGGAGIVVDRKGDPGAWLCDLWLAERLAEVL
jgi:hypothetical protein